VPLDEYDKPVLRIVIINVLVLIVIARFGVTILALLKGQERL